MSYCTLNDIKALLPEQVIIELTDDEMSGMTAIEESADDCAAVMERIRTAITTADAEIDGYCAARYAVPFGTVPAVIKGLSVEIAIYYLQARKGAPEKIVNRYEKAVARLRDISKGVLTLGVDPPPAESTAQADSAACNKTGEDRVFTRDKMRGF